MALNRYAPHRQMTKARITRNVHEAHAHACKALTIAQLLEMGEPESGAGFDWAASSPMTGVSTMAAIDILTAAGRLADFVQIQSKLMELVYNGLEVIDHLADDWASAGRQRDYVKQRVQSLSVAVQSASTGEKTAFYIPSSMEAAYQFGDDIVYGLPRLQYLQALGIGERVSRESDLLEINTQ